MSAQRYTGPDIFRALCCIGVVTYHTFDDILVFTAGRPTASMLIYFLASFCVSGFFMLSGYLAGKKKEIDAVYPFRKIADIIVKYSFWLLVARQVRFFCGKSVLPLAEDFRKSFASGGSLPVAWFLYTYMVIILFSGLLHLLMRKNIKIFAVATAGMLMLCLIPNDYNMLNRAQHQWFILYGAFFMVGMLFGNFDRFFDNTKVRLSLLAVNIAFFAVYMYVVFSSAEFTFPHTHYSRYYYMIWLISLFMLVCRTDIPWPKVKGFVSFIAGSSFTIYMLHLSLLSVMGMVFTPAGVVQTAVVTATVSLICAVVGYIMKKIPVLKYLA